LKLVVVGSVALDTIETPHGSVERALGGSAVYFSLSASLFTDVGIVAVVGGDFGSERIDILKSRGIDTSGLVVREDEKTFFWHGSYSEDMSERKSISTELNVFSNFTPEIPDSYLGASYLFLANIDPKLQLNVLGQMGGDTFSGCDTMNFWIEGSRGNLLEVLERVPLLFINDSEATMLTGRKNLLKAGKALLGMGPERVIIKKGEHGSIMFSDNGLFILPAFPLENVVDPTGAGDSFAGAFMGYIASSNNRDEKTFKEALIYATVVASFACENFSVDGLMKIGRKEVEERKEIFASFFSI